MPRGEQQAKAGNATQQGRKETLKGGGSRSGALGEERQSLEKQLPLPCQWKALPGKVGPVPGTEASAVPM